MSSEARKDELKMSWNKKVSMREIAQFYEDRLRELDIRQTKLMEEISKKEAEIETRTRTLESSLEDAKGFIEKLEEIIKQINEVRNAVISPYESIRAHLDGLDKSFDILQGKIKLVRDGLINSIVSQAINHTELGLFENFVGGTILSMNRKMIETELSAIDDVVLREKMFSNAARTWTRSDLKGYPDLLMAMEQNPSAIRRISEVGLARHREFLKGLLTLVDRLGDNGDLAEATEHDQVSVTFFDDSGNLIERHVKNKEQNGGASND